MTGLLASVNSLHEARLVLAENVDVIDLKDPASGSLGGLDIGIVREIVAVVNGERPCSATIGDLPMQPDLIFDTVSAMAGTGVDYVKIGFFPGGKQLPVIDKLALLADRVALVAVLFADAKPDFSLIDNLKAAGFYGVMLDTLDKTKGSLTSTMSKAEIERFVRYVKSCKLICGLAGSLTLADIPELMSYQPDYLGFRGALCDQHQRAGRLNASSVQNIRQTIAEFSR